MAFTCVDKIGRDEQWPVWNRNEEEDVSIQRHLPKVEAEVEALLRDAGTRDAYERSCRLYGDQVAALAAGARDG